MYKVKTIDFLRREVPIVLQNENGPCPLLALANTLLLRNAIYLPPNTPDVSQARSSPCIVYLSVLPKRAGLSGSTRLAYLQERLVSLIAGHLLDTNSEERLASHGDEYRANLQQNVEDAMALLPKLTTGVDVNVRFDSIRGFEFTRETAIFDLLDIRLVHGWLVDPQVLADLLKVCLWPPFEIRYHCPLLLPVHFIQLLSSCRHTGDFSLGLNSPIG